MKIKLDENILYVVFILKKWKQYLNYPPKQQMCWVEKDLLAYTDQFPCFDDECAG